MFLWLVPIISKLFDLLNLVVIVRVLLSWIPHDRYNPLIKIVYDITDPLFAPFQGKMIFGAIDFSPIIVLVLIGFVQNIVIGLFSAF